MSVKAPRRNQKLKRVPQPLQATVFNTDLGWIAVAWRAEQLALISFGHDSPAAAAERVDAEPMELSEVPKWVAKVIEKIKKFAAGKPVDWSDVPLGWEKQTPFQQRVRAACRAIPRGEVRSYGELAAAAGFPGAARAVGSVMRTNRFPLIIPCHRVVASGGKFGGFSCPAGVEMKERLLALEGFGRRRAEASTSSGRRS